MQYNENMVCYQIMYIERSTQEIPRTEEAGQRALSLPLYDLADLAPPVSQKYSLSDVRHPFSNDESAAYFDQAQSRSQTPEFQQATNRVAVLVGESSLMLNLPFIPEETIILLDSSEPMTSYMSDYVEALRTADNADDWARRAGVLKKRILPRFGLPDRGEERALYFLRHLGTEWVSEGYIHPAMDVNAFDERAKLARQKAIIPWHGDITSIEDMAKLGDALKQRNANVTMLNLSNVLSVYYGHVPMEKFVDGLEQLPLVDNAPILTTSIRHKYTTGPIMEATGPFFGLDNLRVHGLNEDGFSKGAGAAIDRDYFGEDDSAEAGILIPLHGLLDALIRAAGGPKPPKGFSMDPMGGVVLLGEDGSEEVPIDDLPDVIQSALRGLTGR